MIESAQGSSNLDNHMKMKHLYKNAESIHACVEPICAPHAITLQSIFLVRSTRRFQRTDRCFWSSRRIEGMAQTAIPPYFQIVTGLNLQAYEFR